MRVNAPPVKADNELFIDIIFSVVGMAFQWQVTLPATFCPVELHDGARQIVKGALAAVRFRHRAQKLII